MSLDLTSSTSAAPAHRSLRVGLDVGGTKIQAVAAGPDGQVLARARVATDAASAESSIGSIAAAIEALLAAAHATPESIAAIGLGIPGQVQDGVVNLAVNLNLVSFPLAAWLTQTYGAPAYLENDVRAAALGAFDWANETSLTAAHRPNSLVYLSVGTGVSAGVIIDGRLYRGKTGLAGEIGHAVIDPSGARCRCGTRGCLEAIVAGWAIAQQAETALAQGRASSLARATPLNAAAVFQAAREGDPLANEITQRVGFFLSRAIYNIFITYDVDLLVIGGGVSRAGEAFFAPIQAGLEQMRAESPVVGQFFEGRESILLLPPDADPVERGVLRLAAQALRPSAA